LIRSQPQPIAGYQLIRELGRGGMGVVSLARRTADGLLVALKTIIPAEGITDVEIQRFLREADIHCRLEHPHIVSFLETGRTGVRLFFAMEYVAGTNALELVKAQGPLPVARAVGLVCQLLEALEYAHTAGYIHRDIKPANLLVTQRDGRDWVKLADFGLARIYQTSRLSGLTLTGDMGGTYPFMAPEQIINFREVRPPADQYSAAATLYHLLTAKLIFDVPLRSQEWLLKVLQDNPVPIRSRRADVPKELADIVHCALAKEPEKRFPGVGEMRQALTKFAS
jgi:serine/threonine-protein kinase